jgi:hypothetical protein
MVRMRRRRSASLAVAGALAALSASCATVQAPPGGPVDKEPPQLVATAPDSGMVGLGALRVLRFLFSEKMEPQAPASFLRLYPEVEIAGAKWYGRREVEVRLAQPLPADTVIVVEVTKNLKDAHRVSGDRNYRFPIATADAIPGGAITGQLVLGDKPLLNGVVELFGAGPETLAAVTAPILRRAETDSLGRYHLAWLPAPGGPWRLRFFADSDGDGRRGEKEATRSLPRSVELEPQAPRLDLGLTLLYDPSTPGRLIAAAADSLRWPGELKGWVMAISEEDTGWAPALSESAPSGTIDLPRSGAWIWDQAGPGLVRVIVFVDADGNGRLSRLPGAGASSQARAWYWEPFALADSLTVEPGLESSFATPGFPATLTRWDAVSDSLARRTAEELPTPPD